MRHKTTRLDLLFSVRGFNSTLDAMARFAESSEEAKQVEVLHETFYEDPLDPQQQTNATQLSIRVR